jgi:hypothetical protein
MSDLRTRALRTAASLPVGDLIRKDILAALDRTARPSVAVGTTVETDKLRIHRYADSVVIWDLTNAGRRGKVVDILSVTDIDYLGGNDLAVTKFERWLGQLVKGQTFEQADRGFKALISELERSGQARLPKAHYRNEKGVRIDPPESVAKRLKFTIVDTPERVMSLEVKPSNISIRETTHRLNDRGERQFYLHDSVVSNTGKKRETKALYNWIVENEGKLKRMKNLADVKTLLNREGVPYRTFYLD